METVLCYLKSVQARSCSFQEDHFVIRIIVDEIRSKLITKNYVFAGQRNKS